MSQDIEKQINSLKRENKKLNKDLLEMAKQGGSLKYNEATVGIIYDLDDAKKIELKISATINKLTPEEAHEQLYLKLLQSLENIINITVEENVND